MANSSRKPKLPVKQLVILSLCRLADPISFSSVFPYLPEMIESFNVPKNDVAKWAGITSAVFSTSQAATGILWGRASDRYGRKPVILTAMTCVMSSGLLFGFSRNLVMAIIARSCAGASNGNVGILRTVVAEMVPHKELQPKAFSVMPLVWTIGSIFGPGFGGALANPSKKYPHLFRSDFFRTFPYALPNIVASLFFLGGWIAGFFFLKETLETKKDHEDVGRRLGKLVLRPFTRKAKEPKSPIDQEQASPLLKHSNFSSTSTIASRSNVPSATKSAASDAPPYRDVFTKQSNINLLAYSLLALHSVAYDSLLPIFMHYPRQKDRASNPEVHLPFKFSGGFGIDSDRIGLLFILYGILGMFIQFLAFPPLARHFGVLNCFKLVTLTFPPIYVLTPFTALLPTPGLQQIFVFVIMFFKCWSAIFAFPCTIILLTNSAKSLMVLGTLNGVATSTSAMGRAVGPGVAGWMFTVGVSRGWVILPWWVLALFAAAGAVPVWWIVEMDGPGTSSGRDSSDGEDETSPLLNERSRIERYS